jgi:hypothetical protein
MPAHRTPGKTARPGPARAESAQIGTLKDELLTALTQFRVDCAGPAGSDSLPLRTIASISEELTTLYSQPDDPPCRLYPLSPTAISETLSGKRHGFPAFGWAASYVLSCQLHAARQYPGRRDQGTMILRHWADIYAAHTAGIGTGAALG